MKAAELIREAKRTLVASRDNFSWSGDEQQQAKDLLTHALGRTPRDGTEIPPAVERRFRTMIERRATGEPIPYIVGSTEFRTLRLRVRPGAFVPRATSEFMAGEAIKRLKRARRPVAVDLATGIGPVALAMAAEVPRARVFGVDLSAKPVAQARTNARELRLKNVTFYRGDLFSPLPAKLRGTVEVITIHPPYVPKKEVRTLPAELVKFEPFESLTDNSDTGTRIVQQVADEAPEWLRPRGYLLIETDSVSARLVRSILVRAGYAEVRSLVGRWRFSRVLVART